MNLIPGTCSICGKLETETMCIKCSTELNNFCLPPPYHLSFIKIPNLKIKKYAKTLPGTAPSGKGFKRDYKFVTDGTFTSKTGSHIRS